MLPLIVICNMLPPAQGSFSHIVGKHLWNHRPPADAIVSARLSKAYENNVCFLLLQIHLCYFLLFDANISYQLSLNGLIYVAIHEYRIYLFIYLFIFKILFCPLSQIHYFISDQ